MFSLGLYVQCGIVCDAPSFILCVVYVPDLVRSRKWNGSQFHPFGKCWADEVVGGSRVHQYFDVSHDVIRLNGHWNLHRLKVCDYYRITIDCPHPGRWVQAL